jgi:hypothetical protein
MDNVGRRFDGNNNDSYAMMNGAEDDFKRKKE